MIISAIDSGTHFCEIPRLFQVKENTAFKIYEKYKNTGALTKAARGGDKRTILTVSQKENLLDIVDEDCTRTIRVICDLFFELYNIRISPSTASRIFKEFHYSLKTLRLLPERRNTPQTITKRMQYALTFLRISPDRDKILFLDETGFQVNMLIKRGRSPIGTTASRTVSAIRSRNYSIACCISHNKIWNFKISIRPYNSISFEEYLQDVFLILSEENILGAHLVMDNVPFHRTELLRNSVSAHGHNALFLPPYSPFLNPIENMFSKWKNIVRHANSRNPEELFQAITDASLQITEEDCLGYYRNMERYLPDCIEGKEIDL